MTRMMKVALVLTASLAMSAPPASAACKGKTIKGTAGPDVLVGTCGPDRILGLGGDDRAGRGRGQEPPPWGAGDGQAGRGAGQRTVIAGPGAGPRTRDAP